MNDELRAVLCALCGVGGFVAAYGIYNAASRADAHGLRQPNE